MRPSHNDRLVLKDRCRILCRSLNVHHSGGRLSPGRSIFRWPTRASCTKWPATAYAAARAGLFERIRRQPSTISPLRGTRPPKLIGTALANSTGSRSMAWTWTWGSVLLPELPQRATG